MAWEDPRSRVRGPARSGFFSEPCRADSDSKVEPHEPGRSTERGTTASGRSASGGIARQVVQKRFLEAGIQVNTITGNAQTRAIDPWIARYIFPGAVLPTLDQIAKATERLLVIEDVHGFGPDYDRTLLAWYRKFEDAWPIREGRYDERFHRLWRHYLLSSAGAFRARSIQVLQLLLTPPGRMRPCGADVR